MAFDLDLLRAFLGVVENGGFTRAAEALNSTQSTVSAQVRRLEAQAGRALFQRSTRRVALTAHGEKLIGYARAILALSEEAKISLREPGFSGVLKVGASEDLAHDWLPGILQRFARGHPSLRLEIEIGIGSRLSRLLEEQQLDLVVAGSCDLDAPGWRLWQEPLVWAFAPELRLPDPAPLAFFPEPCPYRAAALNALARSTCHWRIACTASSLAGVRAIAIAGLAATPLPRSALGPGLCVLNGDAGLPAIPDVDFLVRVRQGEAREPVKTLAHMIRTLAKP